MRASIPAFPFPYIYRERNGHQALTHTPLAPRRQSLPRVRRVAIERLSKGHCSSGGLEARRHIVRPRPVPLPGTRLQPQVMRLAQRESRVS